MVINLETLLWSLSLLLKKRLAPNRQQLVKLRAIVRLIVDLLVPAISFNQKMHLLWMFKAHSLILASKSILVFRWEIVSNSLAKKLKAASFTEGSFVRAELILIL